MSEESTTPDLVELTRRSLEAIDRRDFDAIMRFFASDAVWEAVSLGTSFTGVTAIRDFGEDWVGAYEEFEIEPEEILDLGNGVVFAVVHQDARPTGLSGRVEQREAWVYVWVAGAAVRVTTYGDIDEARAAAERLAESRG